MPRRDDGPSMTQRDDGTLVYATARPGGVLAVGVITGGCAVAADTRQARPGMGAVVVRRIGVEDRDATMCETRP